MTLSGTLTGLSPGEHGFHVHETGLCEPPGFESAGAHFAPAGRRHGFHDPDGPHAGDLRNLVVTGEGSALVDMADSLVTLRRGTSALLDGDGSALAPGLADAPGDGEAAGEADGDAPGEADGSSTTSPIGSVLISMNPDWVRIAVASRSLAANTSSTWAGVTLGSANRISQRVPPV